MPKHAINTYENTFVSINRTFFLGFSATPLLVINGTFMLIHTSNMFDNFEFKHLQTSFMNR